MNKEEIAPGIMIYSDVIKNHEKMILDLENAVSSEAVRWIEPKVIKNNEDIVDYEVRKLDVLGIPYEQSKVTLSNFKNTKQQFTNTFGNLLYSSFDPCEKDYTNHYDIQIVWHDMYSVLRYGKGHFFKNHIDDGQKYLRRISTLYYMNDDYSGGELTFDRFGIEYKPKANQLIIFPSTFVYNHSVKEVISGKRYVVVSWAH